MKNILAITLLFVASWTFAQKEITLSLQGEIMNLEKDYFEIRKSLDDEDVKIAEITVDKDGKFDQKITVPRKDYYFAFLSEDSYFRIIVEDETPLQIFANAAMENLTPSLKVKGTEANENFLSYLQADHAMDRFIDSLENEIENNPERQEEIQNYFLGVYFGYIDERDEFIEANKNSPALLAIVLTIDPDEEWELMESTITDLEKSFPESDLVQNLVGLRGYINEEVLNRQEQEGEVLAIGDKAFDFELPNPKGELLKLSDLEGQIVFLDFWASWCGPCRQENPNVVEAYNKYKDKGFTVISVSVDENSAAWKKAIKEDKLTWKNHVIANSEFGSETLIQYDINSIPTSFLLDKDGTVIATNLRGMALDFKLAELFDE